MEEEHTIIFQRAHFWHDFFIAIPVSKRIL